MNVLTSFDDDRSTISPRVTDITSSLSHREWQELTDMVMRRMERRMADELARRGRRAVPRGR